MVNQYHLAKITIRRDFKHMKTRFDCKFGDSPNFRALFPFSFGTGLEIKGAHHEERRRVRGGGGGIVVVEIGKD